MNSKRLFIYAAFLCLVACGGGGGGGDDGRKGQLFNPPDDSASPLDYGGVNTAAGLSATNVGHFVFDLLADSEADTQSFSAAGKSKAAMSGLAEQRISIASIAPHEKLGALAIVPQNYEIRSGPYEYSEECQAGSIDYYVNLGSDGTGTVHVDNKDCEYFGMGTIDGLYIQKTRKSDDIEGVTDASIEFNRLTLIQDGLHTINSGSIEYREFPDSRRQRLTMNLVVEERSSGRRVRFADMVSDKRFEDYTGSSTYTESISGRLYDSEYGYVDVTTIQRLEYRDNFLQRPLAGKLMLAGDNGSTVFIEFLGGNNLQITLDTDGDEVVEYSVIMNLGRLTSDENADLNDDDGDGMHNSWEVFYGLDPQDAGDASLDGDGDLRNNLAEYRTGTRPDNADSGAPTMDLTILPSFADEERVGAGIESTISIHVNSDWDEDEEQSGEADFVHVEITMPAEFDLRSVSNEECRIEGHVILCAYSAPYNFLGSLIGITFTAPETLGTYSYQASVYSYSSYDPDESDNSFESQLEVAPATAELAVSFLEPPDPVPTIHSLRYHFEIENTGVLTAADAQVELELPAGVGPPSIFGFDCDVNGRIINCDFGEIPSGESYTVSVSATPPSSLGPVTATISASSDTAEQNLADNSDELTNEIINPISDVYLDPVSFASGPVGGEWDVDIEPASDGPHYLSQLQVTIDLPPEVEYVSFDAGFGGGQCAGPDPVVCTMPISSSSASYSGFSVELTSSTPGIYEFPATVSSAGDDPVPSNNTMLISALVGQSVDSIQAQIDAAADGATIEVPAGYYWGNLDYSKNINLIAVDGPENTFWTEAFSGIHVSDANAGEISGFTFTHGRTAPVWLTSSSVNVHDNIFENIRSQTITATGVMISGASSAVLEGNILRNIACSYFAPSVIRIEGSGTTAIRNNIFLDNDCVAIDSLGVSMIVNNDFIDNDTGIRVSSFALGEGAYIGNNVFNGNETAVNADANCGSVCTAFGSNLFYDNGLNFLNTPDQIGTNGNISADPLFVNAASGDYSLQSGSPAIDAGDVLNAPSVDFGGNPRPVDGDGSTTAESDIGAYEFQPD